MAFGYRYLLETEENGWTLVRFPGIPEALTEGESEDQAPRPCTRLPSRGSGRLHKGGPALAENWRRA